jgi:hypothetical protein
MAFNHIHFDDNLPYGRILRAALRTNEDADDKLADVISLFESMIDGDGSADAHYTEITSRFAFTSNAQAHAAFNELSSAYSKTSGNGSVSNVRAARDQMFAYLRG